MRKTVLALAAFLALAVASPATAATKRINIYGSGFQPKSVTINAGDTIVWTNRDNADHQVVSDRGNFVSPILRSNRQESYSFRFDSPGTYRYHDGLRATLKGTIIVRGAPPAVSLAVSSSILTHGQTAMLTGAVSSKAAGETVVLYYRPYPNISLIERAEILTTTGGAWSFTIKPQLLTTYVASYKNTFSAPATVEVSPKTTLTRTSTGFFVRVSASKSFAGKTVQFQRRNAFGQWVTIKLVRLGVRSGAVIRLSLPKGTSWLRAAMSVNQAGAGYLASFSNTLRFVRNS
jgi:plastocyanin